MTDGPEEPTSPDSWRIGEHYGIHVYEGDRPVATFQNETDARSAVEAHNALLAAEDEQPATSRVAPHPSGWGQDRPAGVARDELYEPPRSAAPVDEHPPDMTGPPIIEQGGRG